MSFELIGVSFRDNKKNKILDDINIRIDDGEFIVVAGQTGSGKTTLIKIMSGLIKPFKGQVLFNGDDINNYNFNKIKLRKKMGIVFQYPEYQLFETSVKKDVGFSLKQFKIENPEEKIKKALEIVGFNYDEIKDKSPFALSGGEKRRVAIAGVIAAEPDFLIFDEPLSGLDPQGREAFMSFVRELNKNGTGIVMITHCINIAAEYFDRIIIMDAGKIAYDGSTEELFTSASLAAEVHIDLPDAKKVADKLYQKGRIATDKIFRKTQLVDAIAKGGVNQ